MDNTAANKNNRNHWMAFFLSSVITIALLIFLPAWFWVTLPFMCTSLVQALDVI